MLPLPDEVRSLPGSRTGRPLGVVCVVFAAVFLSLLFAVSVRAQEQRTIQASVLEDKIRGGFLGQLFGNLNGRPHEFKYIENPGAIESYTPNLSEGAVTDDDTDIEWVYLYYMQKDDLLRLPYSRIEEIWKTHLNQWIWSSNRYARSLMDLNIPPPLTGTIALNPFAEYNISGQFVSESFGLIAPGMPGVAGQLGRHYLHVTVENEPIQALQLFTTMIAEAFFEENLQSLIKTGATAVDPSSRVAEVIRDVRSWYREDPQDWRPARRKLTQKWLYAGSIRDHRTRNGYEVNTACTLIALLYGDGDFAETLRIAFSLGWDADNTAATAGTIVGVIRGHRWMKAQGWKVRDIYENSRRPGMPTDETISSYAARLVDLAKRSILHHGGQVREGRTGAYFVIPHFPSLKIELLASPASRREQLRRAWSSRLRNDLDASPALRARAAYLAIALGEAKRLELESPVLWKAAVRTLNQEFPELIKWLFIASGPVAIELQARARSAGIEAP